MALIACPECGREVSDKAKACPHCGYVLEALEKKSEEQASSEFMTCPECGKEVPATSIVCPNCGIELKKSEDKKTEEIVKEKKQVTPEQKKKRIKIIVIPIAAVIVLFLAYLFLSPWTFKFCCIHRIKEATCTEPQKCSRCGKTWGEANGHEWREGTCTKARWCKVCGIEDGEPKGHDWIPATCTKPETCRNCGATHGETIPHDWQPATCTEPKKCRVCGETSGSELGHNVKDYICTRCKETVITMGQVKEVLDILEPKYNINSVGGINQNMVFVNKSPSKTINYIKMEIEFYNAVGDVIANDIGGKKSVVLLYTGPLKPGQRSSRQYWDACFYNSTFSGTMNFKEIRIEYSDGSVLVLNDNVADNAVVIWR